MKYTIFLFLIVNIFFGKSQSLQVNLNYKLGIPAKSLKPYNLGNLMNDPNDNSVNEIKCLKLDEFNIEFKKEIWKKYHVFFNVGYSFSSQQYNFPIQDQIMIYDNCLFSINRNEFKFGITNQVLFWDGKLNLEFGLDYVYRKPKFNSVGLESKPYASYISKNTILEYELNIYPIPNKNYTNYFVPKDFYPEFYFGSQFKLTNSLYLNFNFSYARGYYISYNYERRITKYLEGETQPNSTYYHNTFGSAQPRIDHFWKLNVGLTYNFNFKKK